VDADTLGTSLMSEGRQEKKRPWFVKERRRENRAV
jgi:hypothetical protein